MSAWWVLAVATAAGAATPVAPSGKWIVEYAENACTLQRSFGEGEAKLTFGLRPAPVGPLRMLFIVTNGASRQARDGTARLRFSAAHEPLTAEFTSGPMVGGAQQRLTTFYLDWPELSPIAAATSVTIEAGEVDVSLALSQMAPALNALAKCQRHLAASLGIDPAALDAIAVPPEPATEAADWITDADYPVSAWIAQQQGIVSMMWKIGLDGSISDCKVIGSSGHPALDAAACTALLNHGRYWPARDRDGKPVVSWESRRVRWQLPR